MQAHLIACGLLAILLECALASAQPRVTFVQRQPDLTAGGGPLAIAAADLDGDGNADLAVANADSDDVSIFWGRGDGSFAAAPAALPVQAPAQTLIIETPVAIAIADVTGDGKPDIVTANASASSVSVLPNLGQRTFGSALESPTGPSPEALAVGDFNGDSIADLATPNLLDDSVSILLGTGHGTFTGLSVCSSQPTRPCRQSTDCPQAAACTPRAIPVSTSPAALATADFDKDGHLDLAIANSEGDTNFTGSLTVLQGLGNGVFVARPEIASPSFDHLVATAVADVNGDGPIDVVVANDLGDSLSVLYGQGGLAFQAPIQLDLGAGSGPEGIAIADFNGDGVADIAAAASSRDKVSVFAGSRTGTFAAPRDVALAAGSTPVGLAAADLNDDRRVDLAAPNALPTGTVSVLLNATCAGDCGGDSAVTVDELLTMTNIALGTAPVPQCLAGDANGDRQVTVDEIVSAVQRALNGCTPS
ncbi:MAG: VCBS repeat-containing protein [Candidatus Binatia bacterium]